MSDGEEALSENLYSAGHCPMCVDTGALIPLVSVADESLWYVCPTCVASWRSPERLDEMPEDPLVPAGLRFPTEKELHRIVSGGTELVEAPQEWLQAWLSDLAEYIASNPRD